MKPYIEFYNPAPEDSLTAFDREFKGQKIKTQLLETPSSVGGWRSHMSGLERTAHTVGTGEKILGSAMVVLGAAIVLAAPPAAGIGIQIMSGGAALFGLGVATKAEMQVHGESNERLAQGEKRSEILGDRWSRLGKNVAKEAIKPW